MDLTILVDDKAREGLVAEHGFALWIENDERIILFDTGHTTALSENAARLSKDLSKVTDLVISHGHYDHTGGIETVVTRAKKTRVFLHQGAFLPRYVKEPDGPRAVRMPEQSLKALDRLTDDRMYWATRPLQLNSSIGVSGPIPRNNDSEDVGDLFFLNIECSRPDLIEDDLALWIKTQAGLVVCVGCSHAGIINTLEAVRSITGEQKIHTVIGGLHLKNASSRRLAFTVSELNHLGVKRLIPCHCTGDAATRFLEETVTAELIRGYAGLSVSI